MNTDSAFKICPRCCGLHSERTDKCLTCGYRRRFVFVDAAEVLKVIGLALLGASLFFAVMLLAFV